MSYEPTQPMRPPATSSADQETATPVLDPQATVPRAVLSQADRPAPPDEALTADDAPAEVTPAEAGSADLAPADPVATDPVATDPGPSDPVAAEAPVADIAAAPAEAAPVEAAPVEAAPVEAAPTVAAPVETTPVEATAVEATPADDAPAQTAEPAAPDEDAPQSGWGMDNEPQGGWAPAGGPRDDWDQGNAPQGDWGQHNARPGGWGQDDAQPGYYGQQGHGPQGDWDQGYGHGPQGDWGQGHGPQGYRPQDTPPGYGPEDGPRPRPRRRRRPVRKSLISLFILLVLAIVAVIANFVGQAIAENDMANQFTANGFPVRPSVNIEGFPFLTQVLHKDFKKVQISASNIPAGPVTISSLNATLTGMHLNKSWNGATIDHLTATAFVSLSSLTGGISSELGDAASLTAVPDGADKLKVTGTVLGLKASGEVEIKQTGPQQITIELPISGGLVGTLLGSAPSFPINLPAGVPPTLRITGLTLNGQGLTLTASATNATFSK